MFDNPFSMVVAIVAIVAIASIIRARYGLRHGSDNRLTEAHPSNEIAAMRAELQGLQDRVATLERRADDCKGIKGDANR